MKTLRIFLGMLFTTSFYCTAAAAQQVTTDHNSYTLPVYVQNKKGKPYRKPMVVYKFGSEDFYHVPKSGLVYIPEVNHDDIIHVVAGTGVFELPVSGYDSINIVFKNTREISKVENYRDKRVYDTGYGLVVKERNTKSHSGVDMHGAENYTSLIRFLEGRVAGLEVSGNTVRIRGVSSIQSSTEPMVVLNGNMMSLEQADKIIIPSEIESITVDKSGAMYGVRGGNGVIIIKTRSGSGK